MLLSKSYRLLLIALAAAGCGPEVEVEEEGTSDWMLGTFSAAYEESPGGVASVARVIHFEFREDGTLVLTQLGGCAANYVELIQEYEWRRAGDSEVTVLVPDSESGFFETWSFTPLVTCNTLQLREVVDGVEFKRVLRRGTLCMKTAPPCGSPECPWCATELCDEPQPSCTD
ncbi:MAG: hypothetical protein HOV80_09795 [Polyangiaceae bacterium]|nr:hypothetical protein [Polyangiaceae bacterium]